MGAHTLGKAIQKNMGYQGAWVPGNVTKFDNKFYRNLLNGSIAWTPEVSISRKVSTL
jgi:hypothetical protein